MDILDFVDEFVTLYEDDRIAATDVLGIIISILGKRISTMKGVKPYFGKEPADLLWEILRTARTREDIEDFVYSVAEEIGQLDSYKRIKRGR